MVMCPCGLQKKGAPVGAPTGRATSRTLNARAGLRCSHRGRLPLAFSRGAPKDCTPRTAKLFRGPRWRCMLYITMMSPPCPVRTRRRQSIAPHFHTPSTQLVAAYICGLLLPSSDAFHRSHLTGRVRSRDLRYAHVIRAVSPNASNPFRGRVISRGVGICGAIRTMLRPTSLRSS